MVKTSAVYNQV